MMSLKVNIAISFFILIISNLSYADQIAYPNLGSSSSNQVGEKKVDIKSDKSTSNNKSSSSKGVISQKTNSAKTFSTGGSMSVKVEGKAVIPTTNNNNHSE